MYLGYVVFLFMKLKMIHVSRGERIIGQASKTAGIQILCKVLGRSGLYLMFFNCCLHSIESQVSFQKDPCLQETSFRRDSGGNLLT